MKNLLLVITGIISISGMCHGMLPEAEALYLRGRSAYLAGDYVSARECTMQAKEIDPCSPRIDWLLEHIDKARKYVAHASREHTKEGMLHEVEDAWKRPHVYAEAKEPWEGSEPMDLVERKLQRILLPKIQFAEAPLASVVAMLSELSVRHDTAEEEESKRGVNIVLIDAEGEAPKVTLSLRNVSLAQVLDLVGKSTGFTYDIEENIITVRRGNHLNMALKTDFFPINRATIIKMTGHRTPEVRVDLDERYDTANPSQAHEELALYHFFQRAGVPFDADHGGPVGAQFAFDGTQLIVTQTPRNLERIRNILSRYHGAHQVEIESKFMEVQEGVLEELGFKWSVTSRSKPELRFGQTTSGEGNNLRQLTDAFGVMNSASGNGMIVNGTDSSVIINRAPTFPNSINLGASSVPVGGIFDVIDNWQVGLMIEALEQHTGADLMSAPKVTVLSGKTAKITVAQVMRYPEAFGDIQSAVGMSGSHSKSSSAGVTITTGTPHHFVEKNVGVEMEVTPTVEENGRNISLKLDPKVTEFEGFVEYGGRSVAISGGTTVDVPSGFFQPIFSTREIETEVTVENGATVVMGGLTREEVKQVNDKVPLLGDIPVLGRLFQSKGETNQKRNLLIFVTANIISSSGGMTGQDFRYPAQEAAYRDPTKVVPSGIAYRECRP